MDRAFASLASLAPLLLAAGIAACSSSSSSPSGPPADASTTDSALSDASAEAGPLTTNLFVLTSGNFQRADGTVSNFLFKNFIANPGDRCEQRVEGACIVSDCRPADPLEAGVPIPLHGAPAGKIALLRGTTPLFQALPGTDGLYDPVVSPNPPAWAAGDALEVTADGDRVPKFEQALTAPAQVVVTSPAAPDGGMLTIARASDFVVTWQPAAGGVTVGLQQSGNVVNTDVRVLCEFPGQSGTGTIPKAALARLTAGIEASLNIGGNATADLTPGGYRVHVALINAVTYLSLPQ